MGRFTVIEINEAEAKVLQVSTGKKKPPFVENAFVVDFSAVEKDDNAPATKAGLLRDGARKAKLVTSGTQGAIVVPKQQSIIRLAVLPSRDPEELAGMAIFETEKFIPFNAERHIISSAVLEPEGEENSLVLLAAVDSPVMENALTIAPASGVIPRFAEVSSLALARAFLHEPKTSAEGEGPIEPVLLVNVGRQNVDVSVIHRGLLVASRSQASGIDRMNNPSMEVDKSTVNGEQTSADLLVASPWVAKLTKFIRQTIDFAMREQGIPVPKRVLLTGEGLRIPSLPANLSALLGVDVEPYIPLQKIDRAPGVSEELLPAFSNAWGTILRLIDEEEKHPSASDRINLLPPTYLKSQEAATRKALLGVSGGMILITGLLLFLVMQSQAAHNRQLEETYRNHNRLMDREVAALDVKREQLEIIAAVKTDRAPALAILDQISAYPMLGTTLTGGRLSLTEMSFSVTDDFTIRGMALELSDINAFVEFLSDLEWDGRLIFREIATPQYQAFTGLGPNRQVQAFTLSARLNETERERPRRAGDRRP